VAKKESKKEGSSLFYCKAELFFTAAILLQNLVQDKNG
jgi:hypothetical protein